MILATKMRRENYFEGRAEHFNFKEEEEGWKRLWNVKVPSKLRIFAWRLARATLPTGTVRAHRKMATTPVCTICNAASDDWRHSLLECNMARCVWALRDDDAVFPMFGDGMADPKQLLFNLSKVLNQQQFVEVLVTLWATWWARRRVIYEDEYQSPLSTHAFITRYLEELKMVPMKGNLTKQHRVCAQSRWVPPPEGVVKINADGAVAKLQQHGSVVAVCRDDNSMFLGASATVFDGISDAES
jgi:hypothetical protein